MASAITYQSLFLFLTGTAIGCQCWFLFLMGAVNGYPSLYPSLNWSSFLVILTGYSSFFFQLNRGQMTEDAKRAAKIEKKLKVILGGYQVGLHVSY